MPIIRRYVALRKLTGSELGWFAGARRLGLARGRQRGINFNADAVYAIFSPADVSRGEIVLESHRFSGGISQLRPLRKQQKNWRLVGDKVDGPGLEGVQAGDFFWAFIEIPPHGNPLLVWDVVSRSADANLHILIEKEFASGFVNSMVYWPVSDEAARRLLDAVRASELLAAERPIVT